MEAEIRQQIIKEIHEYLATTIEDFEFRAERAWDIMDKWRCPLEMADSSLADEINDRINEWVYDNFNPEEFM